MNAQDIKTLIDAMASSDLAELRAVRDGWSLELVRRQGAAAAPAAVAPLHQPTLRSKPPAAAASVAPDGVVAAPLGGVAYLYAAPGAPALAPVGAAVEAGATVCIIEAMKVFVEVRAERAGVVEAVLVQSGQEVDAGHPLLRIG
ncbi:biotin/lipoyl-containing protein [Alsobacter sp. KACC 23698]|uniref:Biotin carboxyl carrier protein of acetyl-CoA carboxylase n=1 Tax=Alsobacter sp. KACC 23698 TaxID=3149229 RepID=A0AAU7JD73_9HYPH